MARKVPFKARGRKSNMQEAFVLCLNQKRHDALGNRLPGYTLDEITAMGPEERQRVKTGRMVGNTESDKERLKG